MNPLTLIMLIFSAVAALDKIFGGRLGLGKEFDRGFMLIGTMVLTMAGMIVTAPLIADVMSPVFDFVHKTLHLDPSVIPASLFANDMGGTAVSLEVMKNVEIGYWNALIVSSMLGCTISFNLPFSVGVVDKRQHPDLFYGMLCGVATIPIGCLVGGLIYGVSLLPLLYNLLPLTLFSAVIVLGLIFIPEISIKIFKAIGWFMTALITVGLVIGSVNYLVGKDVVKGLDTIENAGIICLNAAIVLSGAFPLMFVVSKLMKKPLSVLAKKLKINDASAMGLLSTVITNAPTFGNMKEMDEKGTVLNAAFAVSAPFTFGGHLAFTMIYSEAAVLPMIIGKLSAGFTALLLALYMYKMREKRAGNVSKS